ncbi:MAG TPA: terminase family protein [Armatimonadota bacterium]|jgi:phage FluMu gp28-like protein
MAKALSERQVRQAAARAAGRKLTDYQRAFLDDPAPLRAVLKARQTGFSWLFALEALGAAVARGAFSIFVSLNRDEAAEKILYARELYEGLPEDRRPRLVRASGVEMRLANGGRLLSFPCRAPRGKARASLYLDEMAFYPNAELVYSGALPATSHGGRVVVASTPNGECGMFWRVVRDPGIASRFSQHEAPWWRAPWFRASAPDAAAVEAMSTGDRVRLFGSEVLTRLYGAMDEPAFQQEYELAFLDVNEAFLSWDEINACVEDITLAATWGDLAAHGPALYAGMDVGRHHDATEIIVVARERGRFIVRAMRSLCNARYDDQEAAAADAIQHGGVERLCLDATGLGDNIGERLYARFPRNVIPVKFTLPGKRSMATDMRWAMQNGGIALPRDRGLLEQLHSVRNTVTEPGNLRLDAPRGRHHADQFWALALAIEAAGAGGAGIRVHVV